MTDFEAINMLQYMDNKSIIAESPTYYRAYQPVLKTLQNMTPEGIPFQEELIHCGQSKQPQFFTDASTLDASVVYSHSEEDMTPEEFVMSEFDKNTTTMDA